MIALFLSQIIFDFRNQGSLETLSVSILIYNGFATVKGRQQGALIVGG